MSVLLHLVRWTVGLADAEVWTTEAERGCLARYAAGKRKLVEVGVWHARTSKSLRAAMASDGVLYAVDPYEPGRLGFSIPRVVGRSEPEQTSIRYAREVVSQDPRFELIDAIDSLSVLKRR